MTQVYIDDHRTARSSTQDNTCSPVWNTSGGRMMLAVDNPKNDICHIRVRGSGRRFREMMVLLHVWVYVCVHVCLYFISMHVYVHVCMYICVHVYMCACMYVCLFACMHGCLYI